MRASSSSVNPSARCSCGSGATCVKQGSLAPADDGPLPAGMMYRMSVSIRRAASGDLDFLFELVNDADVEPFLGGRATLDREGLRAEIERSAAEPEEFGRFVIEVDGEPAGAM